VKSKGFSLFKVEKSALVSALDAQKGAHFRCINSWVEKSNDDSLSNLFYNSHSSCRGNFVPNAVANMFCILQSFPIGMLRKGFFRSGMRSMTKRVAPPQEARKLPLLTPDSYPHS